MTEISSLDIATIMGGAADLTEIRQEAQRYCPATVARYASLSDADIDRPTAEKLGSECLAEMNPIERAFARGRVEAGIAKAFPQ